MFKQTLVGAISGAIVGIVVAIAVVSMNGGMVGATSRAPNVDAEFKSVTTSEGLTVGTTFTATGGAATFATTTADAFTEGGSVAPLTPTSSSITLTQANLLNNKVITFTASTTMPALTVTLPATSTMTTLLPDAGDYRTWIIENPFTAAATTTTIAAGTGIDLQEPDGQNVVIGINNYAWLTCFREASTDVVCRVDETIPAD